MTSTPIKKNNPFVSVKCVCPICRQPGVFSYVKSKLFKPKEVEDDHHVVSYVCEFPEYCNIRPENYYIWYCQHCHFADSQDGFRNKETTGKLDILRDKLLIENKLPDGFIAKLAPAIDMTGEFIDSETSLNLHMLAFYEHSLLSPNIRDYHRLSKFALRIAWLYRELKNLNVALASTLPGGFASIHDFHKSLKEAWTSIPLDEESALRLALEYFKKIYDKGATDEGERAEITMLFLIAELDFRIHEWKDSLGYARRIFDTIMHRRQEIKKAIDAMMSKKDYSNERLEQLCSLRDWFNNMVDKVSAFRDKIVEKVYEIEKVAAMKTAKSIPSEDPKEIYKGVVEAGFNDYTAKRVVVKLVKYRQSMASGGQAKKQENKPPADEKKEKGNSLWGSMKNVFKKKDDSK